ncbi:MAG TPA: MFS transporter [Candidatus Eisenbacteria bacterium]
MPPTAGSREPSVAGSRPVLFLAVFIHLLGFGILIPLLPYFAETYGATGLAVGLLNTSFSFMQFLFAPVWGRLSDRVGRRPVLLGSLILTGVSYVVFGVAGSLPVLFISRVMAGIAGATISTAQAYIADTTTPEERTKGMGLIGAAFGMGFIFGPAIGGILSRWGYSVPAFAAAALAFGAAIFAYFRLPESLPSAARAETARALRHPAASLVEAVRRPRVGPVLLLFFVGTLCFSAMETTFALFGEHGYGLGPQGVGYILAFVGTLSAALQAGLVGMLARRFGERALVRAGFLLMGLGFVVGGLTPPFAAFLAVMGMAAIGNGLTTPSLSGLVSIFSHADEQGGILGIYQSLGSLARSVGPFLGGLAYDRFGHGSPLWLAGIVLTLSSFYAIRLPRRERAPRGAGAGAPTAPALRRRVPSRPRSRAGQGCSRSSDRSTPSPPRG